MVSTVNRLNLSASLLTAYAQRWCVQYRSGTKWTVAYPTRSREAAEAFATTMHRNGYLSAVVAREGDPFPHR